ncbi:MAG: site-specific integrase [Proteobacteria bacterium]|nr:site-specific integrase [Pseudomonadota bacterium]
MNAPKTNRIKDIMEAYLADTKAISKDSLQYAWNRLDPHFGGLTPEGVTRQSCRRYIKKRKNDGVVPGTINKELSTLRAGLRWHDRNTPAIVELLPAPAPRDRWLTRDEFARLLDAARGIDHLIVFLHLAIATAGRKGALLTMTWMQVRWDVKQIWLGAKPNGKKRATVPMTRTVETVLREARKTALSDHAIEYAGEPIKDIKKAFNSAVEKSGIPHCTIHDLRHTAAVWMAGEGVQMSKISQYLGHSNTSVTERIYARYQPDHLRDAADALEI